MGYLADKHLRSIKINEAVNPTEEVKKEPDVTPEPTLTLTNSIFLPENDAKIKSIEQICKFIISEKEKVMGETQERKSREQQRLMTYTPANAARDFLSGFFKVIKIGNFSLKGSYEKNQEIIARTEEQNRSIISKLETSVYRNALQIKTLLEEIMDSEAKRTDSGAEESRKQLSVFAEFAIKEKAELDKVSAEVGADEEAESETTKKAKEYTNEMVEKLKTKTSYKENVGIENGKEEDIDAKKSGKTDILKDVKKLESLIVKKPNKKAMEQSQVNT